MKKALYIIPIIFLILITTVCGYYFTAYNRANNLIKMANTGEDIQFGENGIISYDNFKLLRSVKIVDSNTDYVVNGGTFLHIKELGVDCISFRCVSDYKVVKIESNEIIQTVSGRSFIITLKCRNFKWVVSGVK